MSLVANVKRSVSRKSVTLASFRLNDPGREYISNGYYGIYRSQYGDYSSALGTAVTEDRALSLTALLSGVKIIGEDCGSLPCFVNKRTEGGSRTAPEHALYRLLHDSPNPDMTAMQFREALTASMIMCGNAFARVERSSLRDNIIALWPLESGDVRKERDSSGRPVFVVKDGRWNQKTLTQKDVFQLSGFGMTGYDGLNLLQYARNAIGLGLAQEEYAGRYFSQDQTPNLVLKHPGKPTPEGVRNIKKAWAEGGTGADGWHAPRVTMEGMDVVQLHPDNQKSQLIEQRAYQLLEVCRLLRLPPHKLGELGRATWGNISSQNTQYYNETLRPILVRWEQSANLWLLGLDPQYYVEHEIAGMLRGDFATQTTGFRTMLASGVYSINEVRGYMNLNPIEGGDEHIIQMNQATVQQIADGLNQDPSAQVGGA